MIRGRRIFTRMLSPSPATMRNDDAELSDACDTPFVRCPIIDSTQLGAAVSVARVAKPHGII